MHTGRRPTYIYSSILFGFVVIIIIIPAAVGIYMFYIIVLHLIRP